MADKEEPKAPPVETPEGVEGWAIQVPEGMQLLHGKTPTDLAPLAPVPPVETRGMVRVQDTSPPVLPPAVTTAPKYLVLQYYQYMQDGEIAEHERGDLIDDAPRGHVTAFLADGVIAKYESDSAEHKAIIAAVEKRKKRIKKGGK